LIVPSLALRQILTIPHENVFLNEEPRMSEIHSNQSGSATLRPRTDTTDHLLLKAFLLLSLVSLVFAAVPEVDLIVSRLFWNPNSGFQLGSESAMIAFRDFTIFLPWAVTGVAAALLLLTSSCEGIIKPPAPHKLFFLMAFFLSGPRVCVELIKIVVARAPPLALEEFGGSALFTPPWELTNQCVGNCSFISGEAANAFALLTLVVLVKPRYSMFYLIGVNIAAAAISLATVASGAHFLSDVVIAWTVMLVIAVMLWRSFARKAAKIDALFGSR
jgi:lipid A 4'-phosphatase